MNCPKCGSHSVTVLTFGDDYSRKKYRCRNCTDSWASKSAPAIAPKAAVILPREQPLAHAP